LETHGIRWTLHVTSEQDWKRQVWISDYATIRIPKIELEIPPPFSSMTSNDHYYSLPDYAFSSGRITTVEGIWLRAVEDLQTQTDDKNEALKSYLEHRLLPLRQDTDFVVELEDPSGMSRIEWRVSEDIGEPGMWISKAPEMDQQLQMTRFVRSKEQNEWLGLTRQEEEEATTNDVEDTCCAENPCMDNETSAIGKDEVIKLPSNCPCCGYPGENRIHCTDIPHFKQVVIIAFTCVRCGYKTNQVQSGLVGIEEKGKRIVLHCKTWDDLSRSVLLSDTCHIQIPELSLQVEGSSFRSKWTTVEGVVRDIVDHIQSQYSYYVSGEGDSVDNKEQREKWQVFLQRLKSLVPEEQEQSHIDFTLVLDDPAGNSFIQNIYAPEQDPQMEIETYERTKEMNEALGYFVEQQQQASE
jgi:zinc finger protein